MFTTPRKAPLAACLAATFCLASPLAAASILHVVNCKDAGTGSLRDVITNSANSGDTVVFDMASMNCSKITLSQGISIEAADLVLAGPGAGALTVSGNNSGRVFGIFGAGSHALTVSGLTISDGYLAGSGGCIQAGNLTLTNSVVTNCTALAPPNTLAFGGAISAASLTLTNSIISNNYAQVEAGGTTTYAEGGGAYVAHDATIISSTISNNSATQRGGGLMVLGKLALSGSTLSNNAAGTGGGAAGIAGAPAATISNTTFSGNYALTCGAISLGGSASINNSTIAFNTARNTTYAGVTLAGGICAGPMLTIESSIVANNSSGLGSTPMPSDLSAPAGATISGNHNLIMATLAGTTAPADTLTADPMLGTLTNNGGPTFTHALLPASPAIDAGCAETAMVDDQRGSGYPRVWGRTADIGAYEAGDPASGDVIFRAVFDELACPP